MEFGPRNIVLISHKLPDINFTKESDLFIFSAVKKGRKSRTHFIMLRKRMALQESVLNRNITSNQLHNQ